VFGCIVSKGFAKGTHNSRRYFRRRSRGVNDLICNRCCYTVLNFPCLRLSYFFVFFCPRLIFFSSECIEVLSVFLHCSLRSRTLRGMTYTHEQNITICVLILAETYTHTCTNTLQVAKENVARHGMGDRIYLLQSDLLTGLQGKRLTLPSFLSCCWWWWWWCCCCCYCLLYFAYHQFYV
jgi:hypothetical protein